MPVTIYNPKVKSKIITATRDMAAASGDVAYTGVGFTPSSITALACVEASQHASWGVSDSNKTANVLERDGGGGSNFYGTTAGAKLVYIQTSAGAIQTATVKSYDADGFTLTWTKGGSPTAIINMIFKCDR